MPKATTTWSVLPRVKRLAEIMAEHDHLPRERSRTKSVAEGCFGPKENWQCAICGRTLLMGERVVAFVVGEITFDVDAARAWFSSREIARFKTPERVIVVNEMPTLPTGKPDREALRSRLRN